MTIDETANVLAMIRLHWPASRLGDDPHEVLVGWHRELGTFDASVVEAAVMQLARSGREFAPPLGVVVHHAARSLAGAAPSGEDGQLWLGRHRSLLPYGETNTPEDTVTAIERLTAAGAHEALLRWVQRAGVYAVRMMPDPTRYALDANQQADRRDMLRQYQQNVLPDWETDPRAGVALERACRAAGIDPADRPQVTAPAPDELRARRIRKALNPPSPRPEPEEDGPVISAEDALALFRRTAAANRMARQQAQAATARMRAEEYEELRRTEQELDQRRAGQQDS
jgi:hypothetical protein